MKYRGLDSRTRPLRWGLYLLAVAMVVMFTWPDASRSVSSWLTAEADKLPWYATRIFGFLAYFALALSVIYGLLLSSGLLDAIAHRAVSFSLHQDLSAIGIALTMIHGVALTLDHTMPYSLVELLVPFAGPYRQLWVGIGQFSFFLAVGVYLSFSLRRRIGQKSWRLFHYATFAVFIGGTAHGLMSGSDTSAPWAFWSYVLASLTVAFLFAYRITLAIGKTSRTAATQRRQAT